jgi:UDP-N-acetylglucosamine--N-acetylmuramyl-(pentapeptide) pyrophosphoryl-undecaprenol N-acetylglucosamine transferase
VPSATISLSSPWRVPQRAWTLWRGYSISKTILLQLPPQVVVAFCGYPSSPPVAGASRLRIPLVLHEANAVMGRANLAMAKWATVIASSFPRIANLAAALRNKVQLTGNPVREQVLKLAGSPYEPAGPDSTFQIIVFGGSQGAKFFAEIMPAAVAELPGPLRRKLRIVQQCRAEDVEAVKAKFDELGIDSEVQAFFTDLPKRMAASHLVIARSGASTVAELSAIGRPAILVPLPHAVDNDQLRNAESFTAAGGGWLMAQSDLTPERLAATIMHLRYHESDLAEAARAALEHGKPDAARHLADMVEKLAAPVRNYIPEGASLSHEATS